MDEQNNLQKEKLGEQKLLISKKKLLFNILIILIVSGLSVYTLIKNNVFENLSALKNLKWYTFLIIIAVVAVYVFGEVFVIWRSFRRINPKMRYADCIGTYMYANLGSNITPAKTGHHPFRIFYLERKGNSFAQALANATQCQIIYTMVQVILYSVMAIVSAFKGLTVSVYGTTVPVYFVGIIGDLLAFFASGIFLIMAFCPPVKKVLVRILAWFNVKTKKIRTKEEYIEKQDEKMKILREQVILMFTHFWETLPSIFVYTICMVASNCLPYVVYCCIALHSFDFGELCYFFTLYQCISYISNIVPVPGNTGAAEGLFATLYKSVTGDYCGATLVMWRFASYYFMLLVEMIYFILSSASLDVKYEFKLKKILKETKKGYTPKVHSHFDTMEMELLSVNFKETQCYNCCHLQNNLFQCDKFKDKPDEILHNTKRCPFYEESDNNDSL